MGGAGLSHPVSHKQAELCQSGGLFLLWLVRLLPPPLPKARELPAAFHSPGWPSLLEQCWEMLALAVPSPAPVGLPKLASGAPCRLVPRTFGGCPKAEALGHTAGSRAGSPAPGLRKTKQGT